MCRLTANAKNTKTHRNEVGFVCFMRISMRKHPLKTPHFQPFLQKTQRQNPLTISISTHCIFAFCSLLLFYTHQYFCVRFFYSMKHDICVSIPPKPVSYVLLSKKRYSPLTTQNSKNLWSSVAHRCHLCAIRNERRCIAQKKVKALTLSGQCFGCMSQKYGIFLSRRTAIPLFPQW